VIIRLPDQICTPIYTRVEQSTTSESMMDPNSPPLVVPQEINKLYVSRKPSTRTDPRTHPQPPLVPDHQCVLNFLFLKHCSNQICLDQVLAVLLDSGLFGVLSVQVCEYFLSPQNLLGNFLYMKTSPVLPCISEGPDVHQMSGLRNLFHPNRTIRSHRRQCVPDMCYWLWKCSSLGSSRDGMA
jgi:hypothetical protein